MTSVNNTVWKDNHLVDLEDLRLGVYNAFAADGSPPGIDQLTRHLGVDEVVVRRGLRDLAQARHLVVDEHGKVVMAHPFSAIPLGFAVMGAHTLWWGGCAWDSFALAHLLPRQGPLLVSTRCPGCSRAHVWDIGPDAPPAGDQVAHFLIPVSRMWDDVVRTCTHQRIFCSTTCLDTWLTATRSNRGYVMDLGMLYQLASHWYDGRLDRGYVRREPSAAADYFRGVGLSGPFWEL